MGYFLAGKESKPIVGVGVCCSPCTAGALLAGSWRGFHSYFHSLGSWFRAGKLIRMETLLSLYEEQGMRPGSCRICSSQGRGTIQQHIYAQPTCAAHLLFVWGAKEQKMVQNALNRGVFFYIFNWVSFPKRSLMQTISKKLISLGKKLLTEWFCFSSMWSCVIAYICIAPVCAPSCWIVSNYRNQRESTIFKGNV